MKKKLNILFIASECAPYAKTGGLSDVVSALPIALTNLGHNVKIVIPKYSSIDTKKINMKKILLPMCVHMGNCEEWCSVYSTQHNKNVTIYFIEYEKYFNRDGLYHDSKMNDFIDNPKRFALLSNAAFQLCKDINYKPDVIHSHDWQSALSMIYLKEWYEDDPYFKNTIGALTIHNIGYQGKYPYENFGYLGFSDRLFNPNILEDFGDINFLKGGIHYADIVNTVSPKYAEETKTEEYSHGMHTFLIDKKDKYFGILNGIDYEQWNPDIDKLIPYNYDENNISEKSKCKLFLQEKINLKKDENIPIIGIISRFASQKGLNVLASVIEKVVMDIKVQFAILGSGDKSLENYFQSLTLKYSGKIGAFIGYDNQLAHQIEAGVDFFIMPSLYEPCGLNQIYSLKYGTLPIVRATGGLDDTIEQYNENTGDGTGFKFNDLTPQAIYDTIGWAVSTFYDRKKHFQKMRKTAMKKNFSWKQSAEKYVDAYKKALEGNKNIS